VRDVLRLVPALLAAAVAAGHAQAPPDPVRAVQPSVHVSVERAPDGSLRMPVVRAAAPLVGGVFAAAMRDGFPVRYRFRLELRHSVRILADRLEREAEWDAVVLLDPLTNQLDLIRSSGTAEHFTSMHAVERALATPFAVDLLPDRDGQYYYVATLEIESLSLSELEEVERWLRGEVGDAITRRHEVGDVLEGGLRRLLIRLSGLPRLRLETRSPFFRP